MEQFHVAKTGASAPDCAVCSMTWGSASADRSIIALKPLPRTPVPAQPGRTPGHRDRTDGALRSTASLVPPGTGSTALFGGRAAPFHEARQAALFGGPGARPHRGTASGTLRRAGRTTSPRHGKRHSSEGRAHDLTGTGNLELFGASGPPFHRDREPDLFGGAAPHLETARDHGLVGRTPTHRGTATGTLRSAARTASLGHGNRHSSERRAHGLIGTGNPELFGASGPPPHSGQGRRRSSEHREPRPTGTGNQALFGASGPPLHRDREPDLFGGTAPHLTGSGPRYGMGTPPTGAGRRRSSEHRPPRLAETRQPEFFGTPRTRPRSGTGHRALRSTEPPPTGTGKPDLLGGPAPPPRPGRDLQPRPGNRSSSEPRAPGTGLESRTSSEDRTPPSHGTPATQPLGAGPPATRGQGTTDCTSLASASGGR